ncbi:MAG: PIN domain-containing protein [Chelatococcus sp.]|nr:PIN domain-containing protein [Chelatococcus sp. YT9]MBX3559216.1 PIN domain-containing protein [Chelatococcus sp.]
MQELWISVVTLSELEVGVSRKEAKGEGKRLREWLRTTEKIFDGRIHDFRRSQVPLIDSMHPPHLRSMDFDELIAATALEHQHTVVTRNVKHFTRLRVEIPVINPWDYEAR